MSDCAGLHQHYHLVAFLVDEHVFALPLATVIKVTEIAAIRPLPGFAGYVIGMIHGRPIAVPAVHLSERLGLPPCPLKPHTPVLLAQIQEQVVGLIVDEMIGMVEIETRLDLDSNGGWEEISFKSLKGVGLLINPSRLFSAEQIRAFKQIATSLPTQDASGPSVDPGPASEPITLFDTHGEQTENPADH